MIAKNFGSEEKTPSSKTGVIPTKCDAGGSVETNDENVKVLPDLRFKVDWLQGTFHTKYLPDFIKRAEKLLGYGEFEEQPRGIKYYDRLFKHPSGVLIGVGRKTPRGFIDEDSSYLEIKGTALLPIKQTKLRKFMIYIKGKNFKCTRPDICIDDYNKTFTIKEIDEIGDRRDYSGFGDTFRYIKDGSKGSKGHSVSFGRRGSRGGGKYLVFYDKSKESKGLIDSMRIELSGYDHYAIQIFESLCNLPFCEWGQLIKGWIVGAIDFMHRKHDNDKNPGRCERYEFWENIVDDAVEIKASKTYPHQDIERIQAWFKRQVAPSLVVLLEVLGKTDLQNFWDFFWELIADGEARLRQKHRWLIAKG